MRWTLSLGVTLLAIYLIVVGIIPLLGLGNPTLQAATAILAVAAGGVLLAGR